MPGLADPGMVLDTTVNYVTPITPGYGVNLYGSSSGHQSFIAPATGPSEDYTLPSVAPSDGQALVWHTGGLLSWDTITTTSLPYTDITSVPTAHLLGRTTATTGAAEAIAIDTSLTLTALTLSLNVAHANVWTDQQSITLGTLTASKPFAITETWNNAAVAFDGLSVNVTSTLSHANSRIVKVTQNGQPCFVISSTGHCGIATDLRTATPDSNYVLSLLGVDLGSLYIESAIHVGPAGVVALVMNSAGSEYAMIQNDGADTWSLAHGADNSTLGTPALSWNASGNVSIAGTVSGSNLSGTNTGDQTLNGLLPSQTGNSGKYLTTDGSNASWGTVTVPVGANPTASVTLAAQNGVATTFMRSDAAPPLSQTISPTMTGTWTFNTNAVTFGVGVITPKIYPAADSTTAVQILKADGTTAVGTWDTTNGSLTINSTTSDSNLNISVASGQRYTTINLKNNNVTKLQVYWDNSGSTGNFYSASAFNLGSGNAKRFSVASGDSATAFQFFKGDALTPVVTIDTTNSRLILGTSSPHFSAGVNGSIIATMAGSLSSGTNYGLQILPTWNQTGTAGSTALFINTTETALGSGTALLIDAQVASSSKFSVSRTGAVSAAGTITATSTITSNGAYIETTGYFRSAGGCYVTNKGGFTSPSDGIVELLNWAGTDFTRLQFGGTTSSFPAIKRNAAAIDFRLADDSAYASITAKSVCGSAVTVANLPASPVEGMIVAVTDSNTTTWGATIAGGSTNHVLAYYNGTNWTVVGK